MRAVSAFSVFIGLVLLSSMALAQNQPPLVTGLYEDTVCNGVPNTNGWFQKRTIFHGEWSERSQSGSWQYTQDVYSNDGCSEENRLFELIYTGSYQLTGKKSEFVEDFWHINYRYDTKTIRIFSAKFQNSIASDPTCGFGLLVLGRTTDIEDDYCSALNIVPSSVCPVSYDIIRRDATRIFVGSHFTGEPIGYQKNCQSEDRLRDYDHFGLGALDLYAYQYEGDSGNDLNGERLNIDAIGDYDSGATSMLVSIMTIVLFVIVIIL